MKTFLVTGKGAALKKLAASKAARFGFHKPHARRAVVVFTNEEELWAECEALKVSALQIEHEHEGDRGQVLSNWARRTVLDELNSEFLNQPLPSSTVINRAKRQYVRACEKVQEAEKALKAAKQREYEASRTLVRVVGTGSVVIDEQTYDVSCSGETVFYICRGRGQKSASG